MIVQSDALLGPAFERVAAVLREQAERFGQGFRMMGDGTIVPRELYDAIKADWNSKLPEINLDSLEVKHGE